MNNIGVILLIASAIQTAFSGYLDVQRSYHTMIGIPMATRIREAEVASRSNLVDRIFKGSPAPEHAYPYLAALLINLVATTNTSICTASILTANRLVTAAHCWVDLEKQAYMFTVVLGTNMLYSGGTRMTTTHVIAHPEWNPKNFHNDIAIIYMPNNIIFNDIIHPIDLPRGPELLKDFAGEEAIAVGFGETDYELQDGSVYINHIVLRVITNKECRTWFKHELVTTSTVCTDGTGGAGTCNGDSGGPLLILDNGRPVMIGITSFGYIGGCGESYPSGYTRVTDYHDYILQHLN